MQSVKTFSVLMTMLDGVILCFDNEKVLDLAADASISIERYLDKHKDVEVAGSERLLMTCYGIVSTFEGRQQKVEESINVNQKLEDVE